MEPTLGQQLLGDDGDYAGTGANRNPYRGGGGDANGDSPVMSCTDSIRTGEFTQVLNALLGCALGGMCLAFFSEFSAEIMNSTRVSAPTFIDWKAHAFEANYAGQMITAPFWNRMGHAGGWRRYLAITSVMFGCALPHMVVLARHAAGVTPHDQVEGYFYASGVAGLFGMPVALGFALVKQSATKWIEQHSRPSAGSEQALSAQAVQSVGSQALFLTFALVPCAVLISNQVGKVGEDERPKEGPHVNSTFGLASACCGWLFAMLHEAHRASWQGQPESHPRTISASEFFPFRWLGQWRYMRLALALGFLQYGHEAFFTLSGDHLVRLFKDSSFFDNGAFIGNVFSFGAGMVLIGIFLVPAIMITGLGYGDHQVAFLGLASAFMTYYSWGLAADRTGIYMAQVVGFGSLLVKPALSGIAAATMGPDDASEAIGGLFAVGHVGSIIGVASGAKMFKDLGQNSYFVLAVGPLGAMASLLIAQPK